MDLDIYILALTLPLATASDIARIEYETVNCLDTTAPLSREEFLNTLSAGGYTDLVNREFIDFREPYVHMLAYTDTLLKGRVPCILEYGPDTHVWFHLFVSPDMRHKGF